MSEGRHKARLVLTGHIIDSMILPQRARVGQAPPAEPPPAGPTTLPTSNGGGVPAKPGHTDERR